MQKIMLAAIITIIATQAHASPDASVKSGSVIKTEKDISLMFKKSVEQRDSSGKRKSKSVSTGSDRTSSNSNRHSATEGLSNTADVSLSLDALFAGKILQLEQTTPPFSKCQILSYPKLPADFGLSAERRDGGIDTIKSQYLSAYATSNGAVGSVADVVAIKNYRDCLAEYGAAIGQAYLYITQDIKELGITGQNIDKMGYDDFISIAEAAMDKTISGEIKSKGIKRLYDQAINDKSTCYFENAINTVKCGASVINIASKPVLTVAGVQVFGTAFSGFSGSFRVSRNWSLSDVIENMKSISKYSKFASEVSTYAEGMESQGRSKEAAAARKKAIELTSGADRSIGLGGMLPNINQ